MNRCLNNKDMKSSNKYATTQKDLWMKLMWVLKMGVAVRSLYNDIEFFYLILNMRGPSYLGLTRSISWLLRCPGSLCRQDISSHDIGYVEYVGPGLTWGRILSTCVISMWSNDIKCKYMFMFLLQNLACKELIEFVQHVMELRSYLELTKDSSPSPVSDGVSIVSIFFLLNH